MNRPIRTAAVSALLAIVVLGAVAALNSPASGAADVPSLFWTRCETGSAAGQCVLPRGIASSPLDGHVFVMDQGNARVDEFDAWGQFVKAWGWGVADGQSRLEICGPGIASCRAGLEGSEAGEFGGGGGAGVAIDSTGDVYVDDNGNHRVQKFDPEGFFLLRFGGDVDKTTGADVCTAAPGDVCGAGGAGNPGSGEGQFGTQREGSYIAVGPDGTVYVGDQNRIQEFEADGAFKAQVALPETGNPGSLALDPSSGDLYFAFEQAQTNHVPKVFRFSDGEWKQFAEVAVPTALAVDSSGDVYVVDRVNFALNQPAEVRVFSPAGAEIESFQPAGEGTKRSTGIATASAPCLSAGTNAYLANSVNSNSFVSAYGPHPDNPACPPPLKPPEIKAQYAVAAGTDNAVVKAQINPHFWDDTSYYLEWGSGKCSEGGCPNRVGFPSTELGGGVSDADITTAGIVLGGLAPGTTYHYRFVAQSSGGGPVFGTDPDGEGPEEPSFEAGEEASFTTPPLPSPPDASCPNQAFRSGPSAGLPDCRAYEMVSPVDKERGEIQVGKNLQSHPAGYDESAERGARLTYSSQRAFGDAQSAPWASQYVATRGANGWSSEAINPLREGVSLQGNVGGLDRQYQDFSPDLCSGWLMQDAEPVLASGGVAGFSNLYRRQLCSPGEGGYEALTTAEPPDVSSERFQPELVGMSADGGDVFFRASGKLTSDASSSGNFQLYESSGGALRLVSVLPNGTASAQETSAGTALGERNGRDFSVANAVSADGSRVFWTASEGIGRTMGKIYLRENPDREQSASGACDEAEKACTIAVSETVSGAAALFWTASPEGDRAIFSIGENLYEFDVESGTSGLIAGGFKGLLGASEDASRIYLVSTEARGGDAAAGKPNLYLYEAGGFTFVATLSAADVASSNPNVPLPVRAEPSRHTARVTADGLQVAFMSTASLTGADNTDQSSPANCGAAGGLCDAEVYLFDATADGGAGKLVCVSCNRSGARPAGRNIGTGNGAAVLWAAAQIPTFESQFYGSRVLAENGKRLFFESFEPLVSRDTNGKEDVYEWEAAETGDCTEALAEFVAATGGCVRLISSGQSPADSEFVDATADGSEVFFKTGASLLPQDPGLIDIYDARVDGGFPPPPASKAGCEGEACQGPSSPPDDSTPASSSFQGPGNLREAAASSRPCPKGRRKAGKGRKGRRKAGKGRCVKASKGKHAKKKHTKRARRAGHHRRAGR